MFPVSFASGGVKLKISLTNQFGIKNSVKVGLFLTYFSNVI